MSEGAYWAVLTATILESNAVSDGAKLFYAQVSRRTNRLGYCWASNRTLSEELGVCGRTITRYVAELEAAGFVTTEQVGVSDRKRRHERRIRLAVPFPFDLAKNGEIKSSETLNVDKNVHLNVDKNGDINVDKNVHPIEVINKSNKITPYSPPQGDAGGELFDRFWALYPKKRNKPAALRAWRRLNPTAALCMTMSRALKRQMSSEEWQKDGGRYVPYPASWLNGARWEDSQDETPLRGGDAPRQEGWGWQ